MYSVGDTHGGDLGAVERLLEVDHRAGRLHHRVPLVVLHQLGQRLEDLATSDVVTTILKNQRTLKIVKLLGQILDLCSLSLTTT